MTIPGNSDLLQTFLPVYDYIPEKWEDARQALIEYLKKNSETTNVREVGWYLDVELLSGKQFFPGTSTQANEYREILRKVIDVGTLPNAGTTNTPHNILFDANFSLIQMYLSATDPVGLTAFSTAYWSVSGAEDIIVNIDATNINITTLSNYSAYTRAYVVVEYIQQT